MPEIIPLDRMMTVTPTTTPPSSKLPAASEPEKAPATAPPAAPTGAEPQEAKAESDPRFAALTRKEKALYRMRKELAQEKRLMELERQQSNPWREAAEIAKQNKSEALKRLGITYDELTSEQLAAMGQELTPAQIAEQKALEVADKRFNELKEQEAQRITQQQQQHYQAAKQQIVKSVKTYAESQPNDFGLVNKLSAYDTIGELIELTFHETGELMPVEAATKEVEEAYTQYAVELLDVEKIRSHPSLQKADPKLASSQMPNQQPKTLTHKTSVAPPAAKSETYQDKKRRLIEKYWNQPS